MQFWKKPCIDLIITLLGFLMLQGPAGAAETEYNLGVGAYRTKDYASARRHWQNAVKEGEPSAMNTLGFLLFNGLGGPRDETRAVSLWTDAAKAGQDESQWHLADALERGKGVKADMTEAYAWYRCAVASMQAVADEDDAEERAIMADAKNALVRVLSQLPEDQVAKAEARAREYVRQFAAKAAGKLPETARP